MEFQSVVAQTQTLTSRFNQSLPLQKFKLHFLQSRFLNTPHHTQCRIPHCRNLWLGNYRGGRLKSRTKRGVSSATQQNNDQSLPEEENIEKESKSDIAGSVQILDWRAFRAKLFAAEQVGKSSRANSGSESEVDFYSVNSIGSKWAHPLHEPEPGCLLLATEKQDGTRSFERTVILLFRVDTEGSFGVILNRPLHSSLIHRRPTHPDMSTVFSNCPLYFGGPLDARLFLLASKDKNAAIDDFEEVFPGLYYGGRDCLHHAAELVRHKVLASDNFRFFHGFCDWDLEQLKEEISFNYWHVAACSSDLMTSAISVQSPDLWEEVLHLMGDKYAELGRKSKQDNI